MPFKTTLNWLFNVIWCSLVIGSFNQKIAVFQRVYYILNVRLRDWDQAQYLCTGMALKYRKQADADLQYQMKLLYQLGRIFVLQK